MASKQPAAIEVSDDDFPNSGPQNPVEAQSYRDKLNAIMNTFRDLLADDWKDALRSTTMSLKKLMVKHWRQMAKADMDVVHPWSQLCLSVLAPHHWRCRCGGAGDRHPWGVDLPQAAAWKGMEDGGPGAHRVMLQPPLGKCTPTCCCSWLTSRHWPRSPTPRPSTWSWRQQLDWWFRSMSQSITWVWSRIHPWRPPQKNACPSWKVLLPWPLSLTWEPWYGTTRLLAAAVWLHLKHKFFNGGTAKEACTTFEVQAKQLSKLLLGKVYLGGSAGATKGKCKWSHTVACEGDVAGDEPPSLPCPPRSKHHHHWQ